MELINIKPKGKKLIKAGTTLVFVNASGRVFHRYTVGPQDNYLRGIDGVTVYREVVEA
jgi:hypothetical protein